MKKVIYTAIIGKYDLLEEPKYIPRGMILYVLLMILVLSRTYGMLGK